MSINIKNFLKELSSKFWIITSLRSLLWCLLVMLINIFLVSNAPSSALYLAAIMGCTCGSILALSRLRFSGFVIFLIALFFTTKIIANLLFNLPVSTDFTIKILIFTEQFNLSLMLFNLTAILSWCFWRYSYGLAIETLLLVISLISILASHRNYRFDLVKLVNDLAWSLKISPLATMVLIGGLFFTVIGIYIITQNLAGKPEASNEKRTYNPAKQSPILLLIVAACLLCLAWFTSYSVYNFHQRKSGTQLTSGVGQEDKEGLSPLNFHQSLGKSNQPMALMRLDTEYLSNPDSPMLYLRETALSQMSNNTLVIAPSSFDTDTPRVKPGETYRRTLNLSSLIERMELIQSVYLIAQHKLLFSVDYPTKYVELSLPKENKRFKSAFRAYSLVPQYSREILKYAEVGSTTWNKNTWRHYLNSHSDPRYKKEAQKITRGAKTKTQKVLAVIDYLSKNAIYTLSPNHKVGSKDDATAAFLFGDLRGYCVHFAHATTFMLRSLGIPARIATGYMVDLSQSRDGHVLLRASDRHAWAEVYIQDIGWVPFDTEPEQVESHAETPVDFDLLDQLMSEIGPENELLPDSTKNDLPEEDRNNLLFIEADSLIRFFGTLFTLLAILLCFSKLYLRHSTRLTKNNNRKLLRLYRSIVAILYDAGYKRQLAETRSEYRSRIVSELNIDLLALTPSVVKQLYSKESLVSEVLINSLSQESKDLLKKLPPKLRIKYLLNPAATINFLLRRGW